MKKGLITDFTSGNIWKQLIVFSMPLFFANLLQMVYNMVDMIVVGHVIGNVGISGVTIGGDISHFFTMLVMGFSAAASIIISQFVGAGQKEKVGKVIERFNRGHRFPAMCDTVAVDLVVLAGGDGGVQFHGLLLSKNG
jgi:Na+-driven multidrug efflux pump